LPLHFGASGLGAAVSLLELAGHHERALNRIGIGAALVETLIGTGLELSDDPIMQSMKHGSEATLVRGAGLLSGPLPLMLRLFASRSRTARRIASVATVAGAIMTRVAWMAAGRSSAASSGRMLTGT
jgi:hypothetical protein